MRLLLTSSRKVADMVQFFNDILVCYKMYVEWLFIYKIAGIGVGYIILACLVLGIIEHMLIGRLK